MVNMKPIESNEIKLDLKPKPERHTSSFCINVTPRSSRQLVFNSQNMETQNSCQFNGRQKGYLNHINNTNSVTSNYLRNYSLQNNKDSDDDVIYTLRTRFQINRQYPRVLTK